MCDKHEQNDIYPLAFTPSTIIASKNVIIIITLFWAIPFIFSLLPLVSYKPYSLYCIASILGTYEVTANRIFFTSFIIVTVIIPIIFTIMLYIVSLIKINRRNNILISIVGHTHNPIRSICGAGQNLKIILQMLAMLGFFAFCWLPFFTLYVLLPLLKYAGYRYTVYCIG